MEINPKPYTLNPSSGRRDLGSLKGVSGTCVQGLRRKAHLGLGMKIWGLGFRVGHGCTGFLLSRLLHSRPLKAHRPTQLFVAAASAIWIEMSWSHFFQYACWLACSRAPLFEPE